MNPIFLGRCHALFWEPGGEGALCSWPYLPSEASVMPSWDGCKEEVVGSSNATDLPSYQDLVDFL